MRELLVGGDKHVAQAPTTFRLPDYPGPAMILSVIAAGAGAMLAVQIINHDGRRTAAVPESFMRRA